MLRLAHAPQRWWSLPPWRSYHAHRVTDHVQFLTNHNDKITVDPKTLCITRRMRKPVCVQMSWMGATEAQTRRYSELALGAGLDVLAVRCTVRHVLLPETGMQKIALELLRLMLANDTTYLLYGLSIGSYLWAEAMVHAERDPQLYKPVLERVAAQIWDSIGDLQHTPTGIPVALFPKLANKRAMRWTSAICDAWYRLYLKTCYSSVTAHYERAADTFLRTACRAPALIMHARNDRIAPWTHARNIHDTWTESGIKSTWKCWDKSNHVAHYLYHPQEYEELVKAHIREHLPGLE